MKLKKMLKYILLFDLIIALGLLYGFTKHKNYSKKIHKIHISFKEEGNYFLTDTMVNKLLIQNKLHVKNQAKSMIDLYQLEETVLANPFIEKAVVFLSARNVLNVQIKQREAIARVMNANKPYYIDKQGVKLPVSLHYSARVPVVFGVKTPADLEEVYRFLKEINKDDFLKNEVVGIHKTNKKEFEIRVRSGDYIIVFGKCERLKQKFFNLKAFYSKAFLEDKMKTYKTINLTYHNQVVCTK
ncbi:MAG: cell division protein FtsQ [Flavobacteriaceae bacterium]|nr:MAG: cell division protein FtsQ [Flavobacteriaceae bacterium]